MENQIETHVIKPKLSIYDNEIEYRLISFDSEISLDSGISDIENLMANNHGFGKSDKEKDDLYGDAKVLWNKYAATLREVRFTFYLNRKQFQYITELLRDKLEYDVNTIFLAIELTNMLGEWSKMEASKDDKTLKSYESDATEITYMYHLISKHKVKGLSSSSYLFAQILRRIGEISKIINYYDTSAKNLSKEIQDWAASFEPEEHLSSQNVESIKGESLPKKKNEEPVLN